MWSLYSVLLISTDVKTGVSKNDLGIQMGGTVSRCFRHLQATAKDSLCCLSLIHLGWLEFVLGWLTRWTVNPVANLDATK